MIESSMDTETTYKRVEVIEQTTREVVTLKMSPREAAQVHTIMSILGGTHPYRRRSSILETFDGVGDEYGFEETAKRVAQAVKETGIDTRRNVVHNDEDRL